MDRLKSEQRFHDGQARQRAVLFARQPDRLHVDDNSYLDHESWIRPAFASLGEVSGRRVLDLGCGHGMAAVVLARRGADVTAVDLSAGYLAEARQRADANEVGIRFIQADGEHLPFADRSFDAVWGNAILHHLEMHRAAGELRRVLRPGGVAVFCEPWGENPLLRIARQRFAYPGKERTPDEQPLRRRDLQPLKRHFERIDVRGFQLLSMARRVLPVARFVSGLNRCDAWLLRRVPALQHFCRYVLIALR